MLPSLNKVFLFRSYFKALLIKISLLFEVSSQPHTRAAFDLVGRWKSWSRFGARSFQPLSTLLTRDKIRQPYIAKYTVNQKKSRQDCVTQLQVMYFFLTFISSIILMKSICRPQPSTAPFASQPLFLFASV